MKITSVGDADSKRLTMLIHGRQGSGKTLLASTIAEDSKTLLLDTTGEWGIETLRKLPYADNIDVACLTRLQDINDAFNMLNLEEHPYAAVVLDSFTAIQKLCHRHIAGYEPDDMPNLEIGIIDTSQRYWGKMLGMMSEIIHQFYGLASMSHPHPIHVIGTAQSNVKGDRLDPRQDETEKEQQVRPFLQGAAYDTLTSAPDYIVYCFIEEDYENFSEEQKVKYLVRIGPHPVIVTKIRTGPEENANLPPIVGKKVRTTIPKLAQLLDKPL